MGQSGRITKRRFLSAPSSDRLDEQIRGLAGVLDVEVADAADDVRAPLLLDWLETSALAADRRQRGRSEYSRPRTPAAHGNRTRAILITSRLRDWGMDVKTLSLELLSPDDAVALL